jgi:GntR family transcriptional regulator, histidine utilization repressor
LSQSFCDEKIGWRKHKLRRADKDCLDPPPEGLLLDMTCLHFAGSTPFCLEERLINLDAIPDAADVSFDAVVPGPWLLAKVPWTSAEHRIGAVAVRPDSSKLLNIARGAACLAIERRTWSADRPITYVRLTYASEAHELVARFQPAQPWR